MEDTVKPSNPIKGAVLRLQNEIGLVDVPNGAFFADDPKALREVALTCRLMGERFDEFMKTIAIECGLSKDGLDYALSSHDAISDLCYDLTVMADGIDEENAKSDPWYGL